MEAELNPYAPSNPQHKDLNSFSRRYRVNAKMTTLREFQNLSGKPALGTVVWLALQVGLLRIDRQIMDGPRPFEQDQCDLDAIREPVRSHLLAKCETAEKLGFHTRAYSVSNSTGVEVHGAAVRMLHSSERYFLQILASSAGAIMQGNEIILSATVSTPMEVLVTTNGPPSYNTPPGLTTCRKLGIPLPELLDFHKASIAEIDNLMPISTLTNIGTVMDHLSVQFFADKVARGIFVPVAED